MKTSQQLVQAPDAGAVPRAQRFIRWAASLSMLSCSLTAWFDAVWGGPNLDALQLIRSVTLLALASLLLLSFTPLGARHTEGIMVLLFWCCCSSGFSVALLAGSGLSIYRDPLYLVGLGFALHAPWRAASAWYAYLGSIVSYNGFTLLLGGLGYFPTLLLSNLLLFLGAVLLVRAAPGTSQKRDPTTTL